MTSHCPFLLFDSGHPHPLPYHLVPSDPFLPSHPSPPFHSFPQGKQATHLHKIMVVGYQVEWESFYLISIMDLLLVHGPEGSPDPHILNPMVEAHWPF